MKTLNELIDFRNACDQFGIDIPDNMFIVSQEIIEECKPWDIIGDKGITKDAMGIKIYGVRVIREFAEVVTIRNN